MLALLHLFSYIGLVGSILCILFSIYIKKSVNKELKELKKQVPMLLSAGLLMLASSIFVIFGSFQFFVGQIPSILKPCN